MIQVFALMGSLICTSIAPTFQDLMDPGTFPTPQSGMKVESVVQEGDAYRITTTGTVMTFDFSRGWILFEQRIGHQRPLVLLSVGGPLTGPAMTHYGPGFVRIEFSQPKLILRLNGDSLCMIQALQPVTLGVERKFDIVWDASMDVSHLVADEWGGFFATCSEAGQFDHFNTLNDAIIAYDLPVQGVMWLGICPPKPYDWDRSLRDKVIWHWSDKEGYPQDDALKSWQPQGNIVLLQSEVMLWKDWNLDFEPRLGPKEFDRVRQTLHGLGMKFIVYTSPCYFLKGTPLESAAFNSFEGFKGWPPGITSGENIDLFMKAIEKVMAVNQPDGLYFDGQYTSHPPALYALARRARALLGDKGLLEWHSTSALGNGDCYLPQADAYVDFILRGEGQDARYKDLDYLRFFVSGYNLSNSVGVLCNNGPTGLNEDLIETLLKVNGRSHMLASWMGDKKRMDLWSSKYLPGLTPDLKSLVEIEVDRRQSDVPQKIRDRREERAVLDSPPAWGPSVFSQEFGALPSGETRISPQNKEPFSIKDQALHIKAFANTYAFLSLSVQGKGQGLVVKLRQGTDHGMSWGPGAMLTWKNGARIRLGTRSDGLIQADVQGRQYVEKECPLQDWIWLRARWGKKSGVVERSLDGKEYVKVLEFSHAGDFAGEMDRLLAGKVPYNGETTDFSDLGVVGECDIDGVQVY